MPKKPSQSSRTKKLNRQRKALAARQDAQFATYLSTAAAALEDALTVGELRFATGDGVKALTLEWMAACLSADVAADGEPPFDQEELRNMLREDVVEGDLWLLPDGTWESDTDYFTPRQVAP